MSNSQFAVAQTQIDYKADTYTSSLTIINPDPLNNFQGTFWIENLMLKQNWHNRPTQEERLS